VFVHLVYIFFSDLIIYVDDNVKSCLLSKEIILI
jgi:hypothetical protein